MESTNLFAEVEPQQKERLIRALRANGHVVGYLGDGIKDAPALKAADVGISVDSAVDFAKEAADIVLMEKNLEVLQKGIIDGRKTYVNTLKYIFITVAGTLMLPYLPIGGRLGLPPLPLSLLGFMIGIAVLYSFIVEGTKRRFFKQAAL